MKAKAFLGGFEFVISRPFITYLQINFPRCVSMVFRVACLWWYIDFQAESSLLIFYPKSPSFIDCLKIKMETLLLDCIASFSDFSFCYFTIEHFSVVSRILSN